MSGNHILSKQWTMFWWNCAFVNLLYSWSVKDDQKKWRILLMMLQFKLKCIPDFLSEAYLQPLIIHFLNNTKILVIFLKWQHSNFWKSICVANLISNKGRCQKKKNGIFWEFVPKGGGGLLKSQNFCKFTKCFFVCQNHS